MAKQYLGWILGGVAVLGLAQASGSYFLGHQMEDRLPETLETFSGIQPSSNLEIVSVSATTYDRGWFSSDVTLTYRYRFLGRAGAQLEQIQKAAVSGKEDLDVVQLSMDAHLQHGPVVWKGTDLPTLAAGGFTASAPWPEGVAAIFEPSPAGETLATYRGTLGFDGVLEADYELAGNEGKVGDLSATIAWEPLRGHSRFTPTENGGINEEKGRIDSIRVKVPEGATLELNGLELESLFKVEGDKIAEKETDFRVQRFLVSNPPPAMDVSGTGLQFSGSGQNQDGTAQGEGKVAFESLSLAGQEFRNGKMTLEVQDLAPEALQKLQKKLNSLAEDGEQPFEKQVEHLQPELRHVLAKSPEIAVTDLAMESDSGPIHGEASFRFDGGMEEEQEPLPRLKQGAHVHARFELPEDYLWMATRAIAQQEVAQFAKNQGGLITQRQKAQLLQQRTKRKFGDMVNGGLFTSQEDAYRSEILFKDGQWRINGQPAPEVLAAFSG